MCYKMILPLGALLLTTAPQTAPCTSPTSYWHTWTGARHYSLLARPLYQEILLKEIWHKENKLKILHMRYYFN